MWIKSDHTWQHRTRTLKSNRVITRMYAAEERPMDGIDTPWFCDVLRSAGNTVHYVPENPDVVPFLSERVNPGDMVIFFGGDDFFRMADAWADTILGEQE